jgi:hypothetical protein
MKIQTNFMNYGFKDTRFEVETEDGRNFVIIKDADYVSKKGIIYRIPIGATTDGASTPQVSWNLIPPFGKYWKAAVLHDAAYRNSLLVWNGTVFAKANLGFEDSNDLILEAMQSCGVNEVECYTIYEAVATCGKLSFIKDRN